jgi:hypothetical protein
VEANEKILIFLIISSSKKCISKKGHIHLESLIFVPNLFCGPLGVQNLFCGPLGVQNLFCGLWNVILLLFVFELLSLKKRLLKPREKYEKTMHF